MPYGDLTAIKSELHIDNTDTSQDVEIQNQIRKADDYIDTQLVFLGVTTPLTPIPEKIIRLSNALAGAYWLYWNDPRHPMDAVREFKSEIKNYLLTEYGSQNDDLATGLLSKSPGTVLGTETGSGVLS